MTRLTFTTRKRRLMRLFWKEAMNIVVWFFNTVCTLIANYQKDKPCIQYSLSNMDRYPILHRYAYESDSICISQLMMNRRCFKRVCNRRCDPLHETLKESAIELGERLMKASASLVEVEVDMHKKTTMITSEIEKMQSLSRIEVFTAIQKITCKPEAVLTFWNLKEESREEWVRFMLDQ